ncbi:MAG: TetR/AcrR family transcriptional regulator [Chitinophagales bacterium]|nr:TetR/AcrR family transcriptional regulator [Chitinophagales bacterium]
MTQRTNTTYQKIIETGIEIFNDKGFSHTAMRDISEKMNVSIGNVSYHFKSKEDLILAILERIKSDIQEHTQKIKNLPSLENLYKYWLPWLSLYAKYRFVVIDQVEILRQYPKLNTEISHSVEKQIDFLQYILRYLITTEIIERPKNEIITKKLAENIWLYLNFWMSQSYIRNRSLSIKSFIQESRISLSIMLYPYLTQKGKETQKKLRPLLNTAQITLEDWA